MDRRDFLRSSAALPLAAIPAAAAAKPDDDPMPPGIDWTPCTGDHLTGAMQKFEARLEWLARHRVDVTDERKEWTRLRAACEYVLRRW